MTTIETGLWTPGGAQPPLEDGYVLRPAIDIPSHSREGILLPEWIELPEFTHQLDDSKNLEVRKHEHYGSSWIDSFRMTNGTRYRVLTGEPNYRRTDIPVALTTAWGTDIEGINTDIAFQFMQLGYPVVLIGPERNRSVSLAETAYNMHLILDRIEKRSFHEPRITLLAGDSRGAMAGMAFRALAGRMGRHVPYFDFIDPCMAMPLELSPSSLYEKRSMAFNETLSAAYNIGRLSVGKLLHYTRTGSSPLQYAKQNALVAPALFSGDAGRMARRIPLDARGNITWMLRSGANDQAIYEATLENHSGITFSELDEGHIGGIVSAQTFGDRAARFKRVVEQFEQGVSPDELDLSFLRAA